MTLKEEKGLKFLKNISPQLYRFEYDQVKIWLKDYVPQIPFSYEKRETLWRPQEDIWYRHPKSLCRARENDIERAVGDLNYPYDKVSEISHIPGNKLSSIKELGRANLKRESRFYCSNYSAVACAECLTKGFTQGFGERKTITMGIWAIKEPLILADVVFSKSKLLEYRHIDEERYDNLIKFTDDWYEYTLKLIRSNSIYPLSEDYSFELLNFFGDEFGKTNIKTTNDYILSNYFCDVIFNHSKIDDKFIDGIIYPSVKFSYQDYNIVIHPRAMHKLDFSSASFLWIINNGTLNCDSIHFSEMETAFTTDKENIKWNLWKQ
jgi:hypothetical protein